MKKIIASLFISCIILSYYGCSDNPDMSNVFHTEVIKKVNFVSEYGNYIYYSYVGVIYMYNRTTGVFSSACTDFECDKKTCPFYNSTYVSMIVDGKFFFSYSDIFTYDKTMYFYAYQDISTGAVKVLRTCTKNETMMCTPVAYKNYLYYTCKVLKKDGDVKNPKDYLPAVCKITFDGGNEEFVCYLESESDSLQFVVDDKIILTNSVNWISTDLNGKNRTILFNDSSYSSIEKPAYLNGNIYFLSKDMTFFKSEADNRIIYYRDLICLNIKTAEYRKVVDEHVSTFCLTDDAIYYSPAEIRFMYTAQNKDEQSCVYTFSPTLYSCDLYGNNIKAVYSNDTYVYVENYTVIENVLYGELCDYDDSIHNIGDKYFGTIDLDNGNITLIQNISELWN